MNGRARSTTGTFTISSDNSITAHSAAPTAQDNLAVFASQRELANAAGELPMSSLVAIWNNLAGVAPVKKFENRARALRRIWDAIQNLWLRSIARERPEARIEAAFESRLRLDAVYRNKIIRGFSASNHSMIGRRRIYCLTPDPLSTLMWSHYGDNHRGICLEFHLGNPVFLNAWEVKYAPQYPAWVPHRILGHAIEMLLTKSDAWAYEQEFRVLASPDYPDGHPLKPDGSFLRLPPRSLVGVIVGCNGNYAEAMEIINQNAPGIPIRRMIQDPSHYSLTVEGQAEVATP